MQKKDDLEALILALKIPKICGSEAYPDLNEKDGYIKWYKENIIAQNMPASVDGYKYIDGCICYEVWRKSLLECEINEELLSVSQDSKPVLRIMLDGHKSPIMATGIGFDKESGPFTDINLSVPQFCLWMNAAAKQFCREHDESK